MEQNNKSVSLSKVTSFCENILKAAGAKPSEARIVADSMVYAELRGVGSHGVTRLESYVARIEAGVLNVSATMPVIATAPATALIDAENGFGQIAGVKAMDMAVNMASSMGIGMVSVRNSNHFGVSAYYAARAVAKDMLAIVLTNAGPAMAPHNGTEPLLGTNPFAAAVPSADGRPVILDMATTMVARGKIRRAAASGEAIPPGWAVDKNGRPTTDPKAALEGMLCPLGGAKGSGLSLMIDIFSGVLSGSTLTGDVLAVTDVSGPARTGHTFIAVNPACFAGTNAFKEGVAAVARRIRRQKSADGGTVCLPGEIEAGNETRMRKEGVFLSASVRSALEKLGARYGARGL